MYQDKILITTTVYHNTYSYQISQLLASTLWNICNFRKICCAPVKYALVNWVSIGVSLHSVAIGHQRTLYPTLHRTSLSRNFFCERIIHPSLWFYVFSVEMKCMRYFGYYPMTGHKSNTYTKLLMKSNSYSSVMLVSSAPCDWQSVRAADWYFASMFNW